MKIIYDKNNLIAWHNSTTGVNFNGWSSSTLGVGGTIIIDTCSNNIPYGTLNNKYHFIENNRVGQYEIISNVLTPTILFTLVSGVDYPPGQPIVFKKIKFVHKRFFLMASSPSNSTGFTNSVVYYSDINGNYGSTPQNMSLGENKINDIIYDGSKYVFIGNEGLRYCTENDAVTLPVLSYPTVNIHSNLQKIVKGQYESILISNHTYSNPSIYVVPNTLDGTYKAAMINGVYLNETVFDIIPHKDFFVGVTSNGIIISQRGINWFKPTTYITVPLHKIYKFETPDGVIFIALSLTHTSGVFKSVDMFNWVLLDNNTLPSTNYNIYTDVVEYDNSILFVLKGTGGSSSKLVTKTILYNTNTALLGSTTSVGLSGTNASSYIRTVK